MDTFCAIETYGRNASAAAKAAHAETLRLEKLFSIGLPDSDVGRINASDNHITSISTETASVIKTALAVSELTGGAFDITVEPIARLWGFYDAEQRIPLPQEIARATALTDYTRLELDPERMLLRTGEGQRIDLGGIAKGYVSDRLVEVFRAYSIRGGLITLGGHVHAYGVREGGDAWRIGIRDPLDNTGIIGVLSVSNLSIDTAGSYQRYFERDGVRYHHIMDPHTGAPASGGLLSATIVCKSGAMADAMATACFVLGAEQAIRLWCDEGGFEMILVTTDKQVFYTSELNITNRSGSYAFVEISKG